ncbi:hypothetical protein [Arsukibacterium perlucidum]|uniref:hypothetical protein n=1 Tax=Arsukibacterium perlucidum TaxID=368811 RepID=UPI000363E207|nr:hypothetical protein [Arsukibacterium perlucidum]
MKELKQEEIKYVSGGFFWFAAPIVVAGGYTYGKDRAERDNRRKEKAEESACEK